MPFNRFNMAGREKKGARTPDFLGSRWRSKVQKFNDGVSVSAILRHGIWNGNGGGGKKTADRRGVRADETAKDLRRDRRQQNASLLRDSFPIRRRTHK